MRRTLLYLFFVWFCIGSIQSQELTHITIETLVAGGLKDSLNIDQQKKVQSLTLTGSMDKDDFYFIRDHLKALRKLDMKEVDVDTIPKESFSDMFNLKQIFLPKSLTYIASYAFNGIGGTIYISGLFPQLGSKAMDSYLRVMVSDDNEYCCFKNGNVYSSDGKFFYYCNTSCLGWNGEDVFLCEVLEGVEVIATRSFDNAFLRRIVFPSSLKRIESNAFENTKGNAYVGHDSGPEYLFFKSPEPPVLADNVFTENDLFGSFYIHVPCREKYLSSDAQWSFFYKIVEEGENWPPPSSVSSEKKSSPLHITCKDSSLFLHGVKEISKVDVISSDGVLIQTYSLSGMDVELPVSISGLIYLRVSFLDSENIVVKILR